MCVLAQGKRDKLQESFKDLAPEALAQKMQTFEQSAETQTAMRAKVPPAPPRPAP